MGIVDHNSKFNVDYDIKTVIETIDEIKENIDGFKFDKFNENLKTFYFKAGVSLMSWGEKIEISLSSNQDNSTEINILSTPKTGVMFGGGMDMGKNRKNIRKFMDSLSVGLSKKAKIVKNAAATNNLDEIKKLKELFDMGAINEQEFEDKKKELLNL